MRLYKEGEQKEIYKTFDLGGTLWFIERTDTNQFHYVRHKTGPVHKERHYNEWADTIGLFMLSGAYLTKAAAKKRSNNLREGGCRCCGHGSKLISTEITEHEFIAGL